MRNPDGSTKDLTPGQKLNANFLGWSHDDRSFFIQSNERDQHFFDLYEYAADGYARERIYQNLEGLDAGAVSRDKRFIALTKPYTTNDSDIFLLDRKTRKTVNITAHKGNISNYPSDFSPDGTKLLYVSDEGREFKSLWSYEIATGEKSTSWADYLLHTWNRTAEAEENRPFG